MPASANATPKYACERDFSMELSIGAQMPTPNPEIPKKKKKTRLRELFRKVRANFSLLSCDTSQEPNGNCSDKLIQMNFFILGGFFRVDFPPLSLCPVKMIFMAFFANDVVIVSQSQ